MNYRMIKYTLGWLLLFESGFFILPIATGIAYDEWRELLSFVWSNLIAGGVGMLLILKKPKHTTLYSRDGFVIVALSWIFLSLFGCLPFMFSGSTTSFIDALFETVSGFTTTGASILSDVEIQPRCILIWRSFINWIGGMGVLVFVMAFLPLGGAHNMSIMKAESPGPSVSKLVPRVKTTALILYVIYFAMTFVMFVMLLFDSVPVFDALCISFSTGGTGGFGIKNDGISSYSSITQVIITVFMLLFSINFSSYYLALRGKIKDALNSEVRIFLLIVVVAIAIITGDLILNNYDYTFGEAVRHSAFSVASIISTTGFATENFDLWPNLSKTILVLLMFTGACAGSTAGGIKISRIIILIKGMVRELKMALHPRQVKKISVDSRRVEHEVVRSINSYIVCYFMLFAFSVLLMSFDETDLVTTFTAVASAINNVGPGLAEVGPAANYGGLSALSKITLTFDMLAGRLELFPMLILFNPSTWKK